MDDRDKQIESLRLQLGKALKLNEVFKMEIASQNDEILRLKRKLDNKKLIGKI